MLRTRWLLVLAMLASIVAFAGCGSNGEAAGADSVQRVSQASRNYSSDDFISIGCKQLKTYNVDALTGATAASHGFWRSDGQDAKDYELRFYDSHEDAVQQGSILAAEVTGEDALIFEDDMTWKEGARDRRHQTTFAINNGGELVPTYMDYAIHGNVVMLCEGLDSAQSLKHCNALISVLPE